MANRPIMRNDLEVRNFFSIVGINEVQPIAANHHVVSRCSITLPPNNRQNQIPAPAKSIIVMVLIEGSTDRQLEDAEVQSLQQYNGSPFRRARRGWSPLRAVIAEYQDPGRCPDLRAEGRVEQDQVPYQVDVPRFVAFLCRKKQVGVYRQLGLDLGVGPAIRQEIPSPLGGEVLQIIITHNNFAAMIEDYLRQRCRPLEVARFSVGEPLTERARTALLPATWATPYFFCFDGRGALIYI